MAEIYKSFFKNSRNNKVILQIYKIVLLFCTHCYIIKNSSLHKKKEGYPMKRIAFTGDLGFSSKYFRGTYDKEDLLHPELVAYLNDSDYTVVNVEEIIAPATNAGLNPCA